MGKIPGLFVVLLWMVGCQNSSMPGQGLEVVSTFPDGSVKVDRMYNTTEGVKVAYYEREYHPGGQLFKEGPLKNDKPDGLWKSYFQNSTLWSEGEFDEGVRNGLTRTYHDNGHLYYEGYYTFGVKDSLWKFWNAEGTLIKEVDFSKK